MARSSDYLLLIHLLESWTAQHGRHISPSITQAAFASSFEEVRPLLRRLYFRPFRLCAAAIFLRTAAETVRLRRMGTTLDSLGALLLTGLYFGVRYHSICMSAAIGSIPSQRFCNRMFSFDECWLLSWLAMVFVRRVLFPSITVSPDHCFAFKNRSNHATVRCIASI